MENGTVIEKVNLTNLLGKRARSAICTDRRMRSGTAMTNESK